MSSARFPLSFLVLTFLALLCTAAGLAVLAGIGRTALPLFGDDMAAYALLVTAVALALSGLFPLVLRRLAQNDIPRDA